MIKVCSECNVEKSIDCFFKNRKSKDGLSYWCRDCYRAYNQNWKQSHPEERKAYDRIYCFTHKEQIKAYREANKEKIRAYQKEYKTRNKKYLNAMDRLRKQKIQAKAAKAAAKIDPQQPKPVDINNTQLRLVDA